MSTYRYLQVSILHRWPVDMQVFNLFRWIIHGNLFVWIQVWILKNKIPAGRIWINPQINSWGALLQGCIFSVAGLGSFSMAKVKYIRWGKKKKYTLTFFLVLVLLSLIPLSLSWLFHFTFWNCPKSWVTFIFIFLRLRIFLVCSLTGSFYGLLSGIKCLAFIVVSGSKWWFSFFGLGFWFWRHWAVVEKEKQV